MPVTYAHGRPSVLLTEQPGLRKKQQTQGLLADTARRLLVDRGFDVVTVAEIAHAAEVSEPTVFNYFPRKEDLVFSGLEGFEDELLTVISERPTGLRASSTPSPPWSVRGGFLAPATRTSRSDYSRSRE